jgi:hypothetical protein
MASLANAEPAVRLQAAADIFRRGSEMAAPILRTWLADPDAARYFVLIHDQPQITVGIAVHPNRFDEIHAAAGSPDLADVPPDQDAMEFELHFPGGIRIDVLTSRDPTGSGAIARYLQKFGEGIQQIEVEVNDVDRATHSLRQKFALQPIYPANRPGANGTRVNFFLLTSPAGGKVLVELVQT